MLLPYLIVEIGFRVGDARTLGRQAVSKDGDRVGKFLHGASDSNLGKFNVHNFQKLGTETDKLVRLA